MRDQPKTRGAFFLTGMRNAVPICLGYFAVSFALGITARNVGMDAMMSAFMSFSMLASAGQFAAIQLISASAGVIEMILTTICVNLRYFLMSCALTQKLDPKTPMIHRFLLPQTITDEMFALSVTVKGFLCPYYSYGMFVVSTTGWVGGTILGVLVGNILPVWAANAMGAAMYGMFLAIVIPAGKEDHFILGLIVLSMGASFLFSVLPVLKLIPDGFRVIILTVVLAGLAAFIRPVGENELTGEGDQE